MEFVASKKRHEFHENDPCDLDAIGSKYKFSESHSRAIDMHLAVTPRNLTRPSDCTPQPAIR
ncbi:MAG: hypothetical protein DMG08_11935 [Acidobacteria bacterium]|nr:MAG: hypothetical protein DMG08_11935 [Acidobacteriota bacterium]